MKKLAILLSLLLLLTGCTRPDRLWLIRTALNGGASARAPLAPETVDISLRGPTEAELLGDIPRTYESASLTGTQYRTKTAYNEDYTACLHTTLSKYVDEELVWQADVPEVWGFDCVEVSEGVLLIGQGYRGSESALSLVSHEGVLVWTQPSLADGQELTIAAIVDMGDGSWALFGWTEEPATLHIQRMGTDGSLLTEAGTPLSALTADEASAHWYVTPLPLDGEGWLLILTDGACRYLFARADGAGSITETWRYTGSGEPFCLTDALMWGGSLYLSGYLVSGDVTPYANSSHWELEDTLADQALLLTATAGTEASARLTQIIRDHYTAVLLRIDPATGEVLRVHRAAGCLGGGLSTDEDGGLVWQVEGVVSSIYSPFTSSCSWVGTTRVFACAFDAAGQVVEAVETEAYGMLRR